MPELADNSAIKPSVALPEHLGQRGDGETAIAFDARVSGQTLSFDAQPGGTWIDRQTGSTWRIDGRAVAGPLAGERLTVRSDAFIVFWFAWRHFQPDGAMWSR